MKLVKYSLVLLCFTAVFFSCKNDVNLNAPYKEYPSIYAILNPYESLQMIRINKVFLGQGDANQMAKVSDSINYQPGEITISLKHSSGQGAVNFYDSVITTANGAFNSSQRVYVSNQKLFTSGTYTLTVKNNHTGNVFTATANPIKAIDSASSVPFAPPYYYPYPGGAPQNAYIDYATYNGSVYFIPVDNAKIYQVIIRTHYYTIANTNVYDYVDYVFNDPRDKKLLSGTQYISVNFKPADYFFAVGQVLAQRKLDVSSSIQGRKVFLMEYIVHAATQDYVDYMEYLKPSLSLNQNKPLYSNFKDRAALGIFTFRSTCIAQKEPSTTFVSAFADNSNTCYKFLRSDNSVGCFNP